MSEEIKMRNDELYHWGLRSGEQKKKHKYVNREFIGTKNGKNKYRYFYNTDKKNLIKTNKVYEAFKKIKNKSIKEIKSISDKWKKQINKIILKKYYKSEKYQKQKWDTIEHFRELKSDRHYLNKSNDKFIKGEKRHKYLAKILVDDGYRYFYDENELKSYYNQFGTKAEKELMKRYGLKNATASEREDMNQINETRWKYNKEKIGNCPYCVIAYDLRRRGFDVGAKFTHNYTMTDTEIIHSYYSEGSTPGGIYYRSQNYNYASSSSYDYSDYVKFELDKSTLRSSTDIKRGFLTVDWKDFDSGHIVIAEYNSETEKLILRDPQINKVYIGEEQKEFFDRVSRIAVTRIDDMRPSIRILDRATKNSKML